MPFSFRRKPAPIAETPTAAVPLSAAEARVEQGVIFDGLTEEWRLVGRMHIDGRLSDALNRRAPIAIADVQWAPADGSDALTPAPGLKSVDPYDLIIVLAGEGTLPPLTDAEKAAHRVHKVSYEVSLEVPPYRIHGTVYLFPGTEPEQLLDRSTEMFVPITAAHAYLGEDQIGDGQVDVILVNRFYLRGVDQVDKPRDDRVTVDRDPEPEPQTDEQKWKDAEAERALGQEAERAMEARAEEQASDTRRAEDEAFRAEERAVGSGAAETSDTAEASDTAETSDLAETSPAAETQPGPPGG
ncbi:MAG TPA: hypothetical protein VK656_04950 [Candidatus Acidoferrum sp.]|nr:hypothetical protein [Candidatus Acidoferrum sp.]